jgi:hypothetical protein
MENEDKAYRKRLPFIAIGILLASIIIGFIIYSVVSMEIDSSKASVKSPESKQPSIIQSQTQSNPVNTKTVLFHRKLYTPDYNGSPSVIFRMDDVAMGENEPAVKQIIRLFGNNNASLDIGIIPFADGKDSYEIPFLKEYLDAGIIDISVHGITHVFGEFDTGKSHLSPEELKSGLAKARIQIYKYYGLDPVAFTPPNDFFDEGGYKAVQDSGFKIFSTQTAVESHPSVQPVDFYGVVNNAGMSRLCTVSDVAAWDAATQKWGEIMEPGANGPLFNSIEWGIKTLGVAVVGIHPQAFLDSAGNIDKVRMGKLDSIIKTVLKKYAVTTFDGWYRYSAMGVLGPQHVRLKKTPAFNGGPAVIFRMDDVFIGPNPTTMDEIIKLFQKNGVPMDAGVEPHSNGQSSYRLPWLLKYFDDGVVDISVHGYRNTYLEFDTVLSGASFDELDPSLKGCFQNSYGGVSYKPIKTNYDDLKAGLLMTREQYKRYFGEVPVAFTVPYDFFNIDGYRAAQDAGFKVFSAQIATDQFPSATQPVDFYGRPSTNGMYRLYSVSNTAEWDSAHCKWGEILPLESAADSLNSSIMEGIKSVMNVAVVTMHSPSFEDDNGNPDPAKLKILDGVIKYIISHRETYGQIITFQSWYEYTSTRKPAAAP